ncbi:MAG: hypothetical protein ACK42D_00280 [Candidatus Paceibacteria bacterium]
MPIILIIGAIIIAVGFTVVFFFSPNTPINNDEQMDPASETNFQTEDTEDINDNNTFNDSDPITSGSSTKGTYQASGEYLTPARTEHVVDVTLTLENGIVTNSTVLFDGRAEGESSNDNQARFADAYKTQVIGKSLGEISLSRVGGASLTSRAFNEAVVKIAAEVTL